jgi:hypothetical protein
LLSFGFKGACWVSCVEVGVLVFEYSIRDFFEAQNVVEACWFRAFFTQFCGVFECQNAVVVLAAMLRV